MSDQLKSENESTATDFDHLAKTKLSLVQLAEFLNVRRQSLSTKLKALDVPFDKGPRGAMLYRLCDVLPHLIQLDKTGTNSGESDESPAQLDKDRLAKAKADLAEIALAEKQGALISINEALNQIAAEYQAVRSQLVVLGTSLARELSVLTNPEEIAALIDERINRTLLALKADAEAQLKFSPTISIDELAND